MKILKFIIILTGFYLLIVISMNFSLPGQITKGNIYGKVLDIDGNPIMGAMVTLTSVSGMTFKTLSRSDGYFIFSGLPPGKYDSNYLRVAFKLKIVFENKKIDEQWELIHKETKELTVLIDHMGKFTTKKQNLEHSRRIAECRMKIEEIKTNLDQLSGFMVKAIK